MVRSGRYGPYVTEELPEGIGGEAAHALALPVDVAGDGDARRRAAAAVAAAGRRRGRRRAGARPQRALRPYLEKGKETRSLESEEQIFSIDLDQALAILAAPKQRRGRGAPKPPLPSLGPDPSSGRPLIVKEGRFGPYVTDGETNASLRAGDSPESLTLDRAVELLAERRAKGRRKKRPGGASSYPRGRRTCQPFRTNHVLKSRPSGPGIALHTSR
jgi:DNA topoisomerase-1